VFFAIGDTVGSPAVVTIVIKAAWKPPFLSPLPRNPRRLFPSAANSETAQMPPSSSAPAAAPPPSSPREHVEMIRRERYFIGRGEQNPLAEDMHQAVNYLSQELYSKDVHFLMELVQVSAIPFISSCSCVTDRFVLVPDY
jgi:sacsin